MEPPFTAANRSRTSWPEEPRSGSISSNSRATLPGYAPDLNPVEGIWNYLKCRELGNVCCQDFADLDLALRRAKERLRHKRHVLQGCITACGYQV
jgi:transposase